MPQDIPSRYDPKLIEDKWYRYWEEKKFFQGRPNANQRPYVIVIPPPNITGILHMGHALNNTIQDILIRWMRMRGVPALWVPGTDHAGIATQNVVERKLAKEGKNRKQIGREKFLEYVWQWKKEYGSTIITQLKKLGCSCDWDRQRFTMDDGLSNAVQEVFIRLYEKGLIYRGKYIINWCPRCQTALSDEESQHKELNGFLYYIKYPIKQDSEFRIQNSVKKTADRGLSTVDYVVVATTRPETMLGDTAIAVHPGDPRYAHLKGKEAILPIIGRGIKIIFDESVDSKFGTGAVKVTPGHDPNDFMLGKKHNLEFINIFNPDATLNENSGDYEGMDRFECRAALVEHLKEKKLLVKIEPHPHNVGHCYRCNTVVEPYISWQWFVAMKPLAEKAITVVMDKKVQFYPERWTKVYLDWMENIRDWCISRQIWWGHRLPVYYCRNCFSPANEPMVDGQWSIDKTKTIDHRLSTMDRKGIIVSREKPEHCPYCNGTDIYQDEDVLDTWFSSWLWPFSTLGWPEHTKDLDYFYPTTVLVTAQEIIFFWVARMIMSGLEFIGEPPFSAVYIHGTVRDDSGAKMSKSLGNIIDPLEIIDQFGTDALRYSIISITATGQDVFLSRKKFEIGRNFANKIWNASRFVLLNIADLDFQSADFSLRKYRLTLADRWILNQLNQTADAVHTALENFNFNEAAMLLYEFFWHQFCDWYIELAKPALLGGQPHAADKTATQAVLCKVLDTYLRLLHPFMPFLTEEIWQRMVAAGFQAGEESIMVSAWPETSASFLDNEAAAQMQAVISLISGIRNIRAEFNVAPDKTVNIIAKDIVPDIIKNNCGYIERLAKANRDIAVFAAAEFKRQRGATVLASGHEYKVDLQEAIDVAAEKKRIQQMLDKTAQLLTQINRKLQNNDFVQKAPPEIIAKEKEKQEAMSAQISKCRQYLKDLE